MAKVDQSRIGNVVAGAAKIFALMVAAIVPVMICAGICEWAAPVVTGTRINENMPAAVFGVACTYRGVIRV